MTYIQPFRPLILLLAILSACAQPLLNSERIERQFGSYGVEIVQSSASRRTSNLYSGVGENRICRTLALVNFIDPQNTAVAAEHRQIVGGASIGAVFKKNGWTISKVNVRLGTVTADSDAATLGDLMDIPLPANLAMHAYRFELQRGQEHVHYATIIELHHPGLSVRVSPQEPVRWPVVRNAVGSRANGN